MWFDAAKRYFSDECDSELVCNGFEHVFLKKRDHWERVEPLFRSDLEMVEALQDFSLKQGIRLDPFQPCSGGIKEQFRWHCVIPPVATKGGLLCLRKQRFSQLDLKSFSMTSLQWDRLAKAISERRSIVICGPTASGKTTFLQAVLKEFASQERVVLLEDLEELEICDPMWVRMTSQVDDVRGKGGVDLGVLFDQSLRLRPDRLVVGEIRTQSSLVFFEALLTAHLSCMTTLHGSKETFRERVMQLCGRHAYQCVSRSLEEGGVFPVFLSRGTPPRVEL